MATWTQGTIQHFHDPLHGIGTYEPNEPIIPQLPPPLPATYHMPLPVQCPPPPPQGCPMLFHPPWSRNAPLAGGSKPRTTDRVPEATTREPAISITHSNKVRCSAWSIREFGNNSYCKLRERIIQATNLDISCLCETFLRKDDIIEILGYNWFGKNRSAISNRGMRWGWNTS